MNIQTQLRIIAAANQHSGILTPQAAERLGIDRKLLARARDLGVLDRPRRGVYVLPGLELSQPKLVATRIGPPAVLSYQGAGNEYGFDAMDPGVLQWSIPHTRKRPAVPGVHQRRRFDALDVVERDGLLVTSPEQTLADLGAMIEIDRVERALESAIRLDLTTDAKLRAFAAPASGRPGAPTLRAVLARRPVGAPPTGSDSETLQLQAYRKFGVPEPHRQFEIWEGNVFVARVDFHWWPTPFGVEIDSLSAHGTHDALQYDLTRGNNIGDAYHVIRRFTYWDVTRRPFYVCRKTLRGLEVAKSMFPNGLQVS